MFRSVSVVGIVGFLVLLGGMADAYTITLNGGGTSALMTEVRESGGVKDAEIVNPAVLPYAHTSTVNLGLASSETEYDLSLAGFEFSFDHAREADGGWGLLDADIYFSVDTDVFFTASGTYTAVDPEGRRISLYASLQDLTLNSYLFESQQTSDSVMNESFTLGLTEGDFYSEFEGSLSGTLLAGHQYRYLGGAFIQAFPSSPSGATATGSMALSFASIPEPGAGLLLGVGLIGLAARRKS